MTLSNEGLKKVYHVTDKEINLFLLAKENIDTEIGYKAYYDLTKSVRDNQLDATILYDLAAEFAWDNKLDEAFRAIAIEDGREDLI